MRVRLLLLLAFLACLALAACEPLPLPLGPGWALVVHEGGIWRYDFASGQAEALTEGDALGWTYLSVGDQSLDLRCCGPTISPDGAWLATSPHSGYRSPGSDWLNGGQLTPAVNEPPYMVVHSLRGGGADRVIEGARQAYWAPGSQKLAYVVALDTPWAEPADPPSTSTTWRRGPLLRSCPAAPSSGSVRQCGRTTATTWPTWPKSGSERPAGSRRWCCSGWSWPPASSARWRPWRSG